MLVPTTALLIIYLVQITVHTIILLSRISCGWIQHLFLLFSTTDSRIDMPRACVFLHETWLLLTVPGTCTLSFWRAPPDIFLLEDFFPVALWCAWLVPSFSRCDCSLLPSNCKCSCRGQGNLLSDQLSDHLSNQFVVSCQTSRLTTSCIMVCIQIHPLSCWLVVHICSLRAILYYCQHCLREGVCIEVTYTRIPCFCHAPKDWDYIRRYSDTWTFPVGLTSPQRRPA